MEKPEFFIYPYFTPEGIQVDVYQNRQLDKFIGGAEFSLDWLIDQITTELGDENSQFSEGEAIEYVYQIIDNLREAANKLAQRIKEH